MANVDTEDNGDGGEATVQEGKKRVQVTKRLWLLGDKETKDPREADGLSIEVLGYEPIVIKMDSFEAPVRNACELFGMNIVLTNTMGGLRGEEAYEAISARLETLESGEWVSRKGATGPRLGLLAEAVVAAMAKAGQTRDLEETKQKLKEKGDEGRKAVLENKSIKAEYDRLRAEAMAAKAAESAKAAGDGQEDLAALGL